MEKQTLPTDDQYSQALSSLLGTLDHLESQPIVGTRPAAVAAKRPLPPFKSSPLHTKSQKPPSNYPPTSHARPVAPKAPQNTSKPSAPPFDQLNIPDDTHDLNHQPAYANQPLADNPFVTQADHARSLKEQVTPQQFRELLKTPTHEPDTQSGTHTQTLDPTALNQLLNSGYDEHELQSLIHEGLGPIVLNKLANKDLLLSPEESMTCITQCIQMGANEANKAQGRDLLVVLGNTGAGKSTSINYWLGCNMERTGSALRTKIKVADDSPIKELMTIGHATRSKTFIPKVLHTKLPFSFCDTPGFFDNRGAEINIANAINIRNTLHQANSARIVVLINYYSLLADRGRGVKALNTMLSELFGDTGSIEQHQDSFIIGITHTPSEHNDRNQIIAHFTAKKCLPAHVTGRMFVVDPLNQNTQTGCNQKQWLTQLTQLTPITDTSNLFSSLLSDSDQLLLIKMSKQLSITMREQVTNKNPLASRNILRALWHMSTIGLSEIKHHYDDMLALLSNHLTLQKTAIEQSCRENPFDNIQQRVLAFCSTLQHFQDNLVSCEQQGLDLLKTWHNAQIAVLIARLEKTLNVLLTQFQQDVMDQDNLAQEITQRLASCVNKTTSSAEINTSLQALSDCEPLHASIVILLNTLGELSVIYPLCDAQSSWQNALKQMSTTLQNLYASASTTLHQQRTLRDQQQQTTLLQTVDHLTSIGTWHQHVPTIIETLTPCTTIEHLEDTLQRLAHMPLPQYQQNVPSLLKGLQQLVLPQTQASTRQSLLKTLIQHHDALVTMQQQHETQLAKEQAQAQIEQFIDMLKPLRSNDDDLIEKLNTSLKIFQTFTSTQQNTIVATQIITTTLNALFNTLLGKTMHDLSLEQYAEPLSKLDASKKYQTIGDVQRGVATLPNDSLASHKRLGNVTNTCLLFERTGALDSKIMRNRFFHQYHLKIEHATAHMLKKSKEKAQQAKQDRVRVIIKTINQRLLPKKQYESIRPLIEELNTIAPGHMMELKLPTVLSNLKTSFHNHLRHQQYPQALSAHRELDQIITCLGPLVIKECKVEIDMKVLSGGIHSIIEQSLAQVQSELLDLFSDKRLKNERYEPQPIKRIDAFFGLLQQFKNSMKVDQWEQLYATQSQKILQAVGQWLYGYQSSGLFARFLIQALILSKQTAAHYRGCADTLTTTLNTMLKKIEVPLLAGIGEQLKLYSEQSTSMKPYALMLLEAHPELIHAKNATAHHHQKLRSFDVLLKATKSLQYVQSLQRAHTIYQQSHQQLVETPLRSGVLPEKLSTDLVAQSRHIAKNLIIDQPLSQSLDMTAQLVACVYGVWSLIGSDTATRGEAAIQFMRRPFPGQILGTFLLLGLDSKLSGSQFLSAQPGDGKSLIIATTAVILGLIGWEVDITSAYHYVTERNKKNHELFISRFNLQHVAYTSIDETVTQLFERKYALSKRLRAFMTRTTMHSDSHKTMRVLLHDECDVLDLRPVDVSPLYAHVPFARYEELLLLCADNHDQFDVKKMMFSNRGVQSTLWSIDRDFHKSFSRLKREDFHTILYDIIMLCKSNASYGYSVVNGELVFSEPLGADRLAGVHHLTDYCGPRCADAVVALRFYRQGKLDVTQFKRRVNKGLPFLLGQVTSLSLLSEYQKVLLLSANTDDVLESLKSLEAQCHPLQRHTLPTFFTSDRKGLNQHAQNLYINEEEIAQLTNVANTALYQVINRAITQHQAVIYITHVTSVQDMDQLRQMLTKMVPSNGAIQTLPIGATAKQIRQFEQTATNSGTLSILNDRLVRTLDLSKHDPRTRESGGVVVISACYYRVQSDLIHRIGLTQRHGIQGDFWLAIKPYADYTNSGGYRREFRCDVIGRTDHGCSIKTKNGHLLNKNRLIKTLCTQREYVEPDYSNMVKQTHSAHQKEILDDKPWNEKYSPLHKCLVYFNKLHTLTVTNLCYLIIVTRDKSDKSSVHKENPSRHQAKNSLKPYIRAWMRISFTKEGYLKGFKPISIRLQQFARDPYQNWTTTDIPYDSPLMLDNK